MPSLQEPVLESSEAEAVTTHVADAERRVHPCETTKSGG